MLHRSLRPPGLIPRAAAVATLLISLISASGASAAAKTSLGSGRARGVLNAVSSDSPNDSWAAGNHRNSVTGVTDTLILHWNGNTWKPTTAPNPSSTFNYLYGISAYSPTNVWAVGYYCLLAQGCGATPAWSTLILHWNGSTWKQIASPNPGDRNFLQAVSVQSPKNVWAVGTYCGPDCITSPATNTLFEHWNGKSWTQVPSPNPASYNYLYGVSADSPTDAWAAGFYQNSGVGWAAFALHWNGTSWTQVPNPNPTASNFFSGVSAYSPSDVWAAGGDVNSMSHQQTLIEHWDGATWSQVPCPNLSLDSSFLKPLGVSADSPTDAWVVGSYSDLSTGIPDTLALHWDGTSWTQVPSPNPSTHSNVLNAVSATTPTDAWAVGSYSNRTLVLHWDGTSWSIA